MKLNKTEKTILIDALNTRIHNIEKMRKYVRESSPDHTALTEKRVAAWQLKQKIVSEV